MSIRSPEEDLFHEHFLCLSIFVASFYPLRGRLHEHTHAYWRNAVESYSGKKLSFLGDKLIAFAGIAQAFAAQYQLAPSSNLAGLWRADLQNSLFWYRFPLSADDEGRRQVSTECAPSWSWASYSGPVKFYSASSSDTDTYRIIEATVLTQTPDPFSTVAQGKLVLQARVFEIESIDQVALVLRTLNEGTIHLCWYGPHGWVWEPYKHKFVVGSSHAVLVAESRCLVFLLVRPVDSDGERGVYTRVDVARTLKPAESMADRWDQRGSELEEERYIRVCNPRDYGIALV